MKKRMRLISTVLAVSIAITTMLTGCNVKMKGGTDSSSSGDTLKIGIENKGYGDKFAYELAKAFEAKTGIKTQVAKSSSANWSNNALKSGEKNNDIDVFFDIRVAMGDVATMNWIEGYERAYVDLSDIYNQKLEGYDTDKTLKELVYPYSLTACTWGGEDAGYGDGKQYFVNWATGFEGLVYNEKLFKQYNLSTPKTTDEMFKLMEQIKTINKGKYAVNEDGYDIYPFTYSGKVAYCIYLADVWWAQYDGIDLFNNILQGKDASGNYSSESLRSKGKLSAMNIISKMLDRDNGYADVSSATQSFTNAQALFLADQAFMIPAGDWLEREMEANFEGDLEVAFMAMPVNSGVIDNCDSIKDDAQLAKVVSYIDGDITEKPSFVSDKDLEYIKSARSMYQSEGHQHITYIPAYSNMIDEAKQFIQFMLSKEGQEIMLEYSYGNMAMLDIDVTSFDYYDSLSNLQRSKLELMSRKNGTTLIGPNYVHPMNYAGGVSLWYGSSMESVFSVVKTSGSYKTAAQLFLEQYNSKVGEWNDMMSKAGVSN